MKKTVFKIILFIGILIYVLYRVTTVFVLKEYPTQANINVLISPYSLCDKQDGFYSLSNNTLDAVFIGSSNVHCNINPNVIWNSYGIRTYDFSSDQQDLGVTYYYLKQMFKTQKPKVVVIDVMDSGEFEAIDISTAHFSFDHMKTDENKIEGIWKRAKDNSLELYFPLIAYHERWKELGKNDYVYRKNRHNPLNGAFILMNENEFEKPVISDDLPEMELKEKTVFWLNSIREECEKHDCECLFIKTPLAASGLFAYYNAVERYFEDNDIDFLYFNKMLDELNLDFSKDYADEMHMNWHGQEKLSLYLGKYLRDNYNLGIDERISSKEEEQWNDDYNLMMDYIENFDALWPQ